MMSEHAAALRETKTYALIGCYAPGSNYSRRVSLFQCNQRWSVAQEIRRPEAWEWKWGFFIYLLLMPKKRKC